MKRYGGSLADTVTAAGAVRLDRRRFLQLAAAAGIAVVGSEVASGALLAQDAVPDTPTVADPVAELAAALDHDRDRIFRFVADEIRYEPYAGILRGARGTLLSRAGNSADQSLLLAGLLAASGIPVRFVSGPLDAASVEALMATTIVDAEVARLDTLQSLISDADVAAGIAWPPPAGPVPQSAISRLPDLLELREALQTDAEALGPLARTLMQDSVDMLAGALATIGVEPPLTATTLPPLERDGHTWVQAEGGSAWLDLDPSFPGLAAGDSVAAASQPAPSLANDLRHTVDFAVIAETFAGGALSQESILELTAFADDLAYTGITFMHVPSDSVPDVALLGGLGSGVLYQPALMVGPNAYLGLRSVSIGGGGGGDLFGDAFGGGGEGLVEGETAAEWLDVRVTSPGRDPVVARRPIFDRVGTEVRRSGVVDPYALPPGELIDVGDGAGAQFLPVRAIRALYVSGGPTNIRATTQDVGLGSPLPLSLIPAGFDVLFDVIAGALAATTGWRPLAAAPRIASWVLDASPDGATSTFDILHRGFDTLPVADARAAAPPAMAAGVLAHVVERLAMGDVPTAAPTSGSDASSVGAILERAAAEGVPLRTMVGSVPADAEYGPEPRTMMQAALDAGLIVIAPERGVDLGQGPRLGWWLVDPDSGAAIDQRDDGAGAGGEYAAIPTATLVAMALARAQPLLEAGTRNLPRTTAVWDAFGRLMIATLQLEGRIPPP